MSDIDPAAVTDERCTMREARTWALAWPVAVFVILSLFLAGDLAADVVDGVGPMHLTIEVAAVLVALLGIVGTAKQLRSALRQAGELERDLEGTRVQLERSRCEAEALLRRVGKAIDGHLASWALTHAEREVALLILKGLSYKEIAAARGTTERTVRHQALGIYRKAGVTSRAEMAAFFLQDMLAPAPVPPAAREPSRASPEPPARAEAPAGALRLATSSGNHRP